MKAKYFYTSLTRISDLQQTAFSVERVPRREWDTGDYVVGEVVSPPNSLSRIELTIGPRGGTLPHEDHVFLRDAGLAALVRRRDVTMLLYEELPYASDGDRMWRQPNHFEERERIRELCRKVRDGVAA